MTPFYEFIHKISKASPGIILIAVGCLMLYYTMGWFDPELKETPTPIYLGIALSFLIVIGGLFLAVATNRLDEVKGIFCGESDLHHAVSQLSRNYEVLRKQANNGFILAGAFMALGIAVILIGAVGEMFGLTKEGSNLTTIAGVVVEAVSGLGLYLFKQTFNELNSTSEKLHQTWKILTAFDKIQGLPEDKKSEITVELIKKLAGA